MQPLSENKDGPGSDVGDRGSAPLWRRLRLQWRAWYSRVDSKYESVYLECMEIIRDNPALELQSIFFGIYDELENTGGEESARVFADSELEDEAGRRFRYFHAAVAVKNFWEEWSAMRLSGRRHLADIRGDRPGSMAYDYFFRAGRENSSSPYQVKDPGAMAGYVVKSMQLDEAASTRGWMRRLALALCGNNHDRLARWLLWVNQARIFHTVDVRDSDPREELEADVPIQSTRIGLIMFVSRRRELPPELIESAAFRLRCTFYDAHLIRSRAKRALKIRDEMFLSLVSTMPIGQIVHDTQQVLFANPAALKLLGATRLEEVARRPLMELVDPDYREKVWERVQLLRGSPPGTSVDLMDERLTRIDGVPIDVEVLGVRVDYFGVDAIQIIFRDISERKRMENEREHRRLYDTLTGLPNRSLFLDRLDQAILRAQAAGSGAATQAKDDEPLEAPAFGGAALKSQAYVGPLIGVLYIDIDNFRQVNDLFQFQAGDELLCEITARMEQFVPPEFTFSRLTGDKFCVFLPQIEGTEQAIFFAEGMQDLFRLKPFEVRGEQIPLTFSAGISFYPIDGGTASELLSQCEVALARAKRNKNQLQLYNRAMNVRTAALFEMEKDLLRAMTANEFLVYFQPQIDTRAGVVRGVEALIRWNHPERGILSPGEFITLAEERGLILEIGEWMLEESLTEIRRCHLDGATDLELAVNVTPRQLEHPEFVSMVRSRLRRTEVDPALLKFEIVERGIVQENERVRRAMNELAGIGIRFHVDDFGTGGAAITYLRNFPIDTIKIDKSFVQDLAKHEALVRGLVAFAESLGLQTIVEGVETREQLEFFESLGCRYYQGFYFARPMPSAQCGEFIKSYGKKV
ncbi:MAG: bifunctional diguanylate cyclase/phosphodiesterase [Leptospirales bacterium]|jgi:diguanylate cyclase (GGDEF)-like protein/PAS domain S-box-containing protein